MEDASGGRVDVRQTSEREPSDQNGPDGQGGRLASGRDAVRSDLQAALALFWSEYGSRTPETSPLKTSMVVRSRGGFAMAYVNVLYARLTSGICGSKTIFVDEEAGLTTSRSTIIAPDGVVLWEGDSRLLTEIRCGLVATAAILRATCPSEHLTVALVGAGRINYATAVCLSLLRPGRTTFSVHGRNTTRAALMAERIGASIGGDGLARADVVCTATNNTDPAGAVGGWDATPRARLVVAQDGGWGLGPGFRAVEDCAYSDDPAQLAEHAVDEFPADTAPDQFAARLADLEAIHPGPRSQVYLYGIGVADVVVSLALPYMTASARGVWESLLVRQGA